MDKQERERERELGQSVSRANDEVCSTKHELADGDAVEMATPVPSPAQPSDDGPRIRRCD